MVVRRSKYIEQQVVWIVLVLSQSGRGPQRLIVQHCYNSSTVELQHSTVKYRSYTTLSLSAAFPAHNLASPSPITATRRPSWTCRSGEAAGWSCFRLVSGFALLLAVEERRRFCRLTSSIIHFSSEVLYLLLLRRCITPHRSIYLDVTTVLLVSAIFACATEPAQRPVQSPIALVLAHLSLGRHMP